MNKKTMKKTFTLPPKKDTLNPPSKLASLEMKSDSSCADETRGDKMRVSLADQKNARMVKNKIAKDEVAKVVKKKKKPLPVIVSY